MVHSKYFWSLDQAIILIICYSVEGNLIKNTDSLSLKLLLLLICFFLLSLWCCSCRCFCCFHQHHNNLLIPHSISKYSLFGQLGREQLISYYSFSLSFWNTLKDPMCRCFTCSMYLENRIMVHNCHNFF